ncbi:MAG TPA: glycosyltransferase family 4 protein [Candidatus Saccharimonadales bacterium]|nr:glycosyltransferase family 4 protein [Candidatus Saccharimonadales bacterium]
MRIALIAPPFLNIPPTKQGGIEAVLTAKIHELVKMGHRITLFHAGEANFQGIEHVTVYPTAINDLKQDLAAEESSRKLRLEMTYFALAATQIIKRQADFDVVFNHTRGEVAFAPLTEFLNVPIISTFHLPVLKENIEVLRANPKAYAISISNNQRGQWQDLPNFLATVYNGVELEKYPVLANPAKDFVFWIGTIGEHKNTLDAILAAKKAGVKIILAGKIRDQKYHQEKIAPLIDDKTVVYVGEITYEEKLPYFQNALATLFPTKWPEPFGLVMIESLACSTPVIAYPSGAVPEVIVDGEVGFVVNSADAMAEAINKVKNLDRAKCRQYVEEKFSATVMTNNYLKAAEKVIAPKVKKGLLSWLK